ncbi:hypothetical protein PDJAM_G00166020 [Pangasius djambal]|uniref:Uncharacterized protein n=1 Tax=Pangasius djambal TaxID=1691987 RepID=A0ACC5ZL78_9TELE|nr:hypothetical protein [Pangasius djambal]
MTFQKTTPPTNQRSQCVPHWEGLSVVSSERERGTVVSVSQEVVIKYFVGRLKNADFCEDPDWQDHHP